MSGMESTAASAASLMEVNARMSGHHDREPVTRVDRLGVAVHGQEFEGADFPAGAPLREPADRGECRLDSSHAHDGWADGRVDPRSGVRDDAVDAIAPTGDAQALSGLNRALRAEADGRTGASGWTRLTARTRVTLRALGTGVALGALRTGGQLPRLEVAAEQRGVADVL